jgi:predicted ATPase/transcriptional regulator with XRE-family HTH domain
MDQRASFGAVLKRLRVSAGLTHEALAERAGLGARTISDLERGVSRNPRADTLALLVDALGLSPEQQSTLEAAARHVGEPDSALIPTNLPAYFTTFVGREHEVRAIGEMLQQDGIRLVTVTGPGGVGKTRLAFRIAAETRERFPDGVFAVALAPVADHESAVQAVGRALSGDFEGRLTLPRLAASIAGKRLLLVLDNCEHLPVLAAIVAELLRDAPGLTVLATSRAPLRVSGEHEYPVAPLAVPDPAVAQVSDFVDYPAVTLFVDRATHVRPDFTLTADNAAAIAAICTRLDGLPLAVELAAARIRALPPQMLAARLSDARTGGSLRLLADGALDLPERHQTLRDTIAWSHDLLTAAEQTLFRRLAVFVGGCTLSSAEVVCDPPLSGSGVSVSSTEPSPALDVLSGVVSLVDKNLLGEATGQDGELRFILLETIREYAWERLTAAGEAAALQERHARHYLALVEATGALLFAAAPTRARLAAEDGNVQAALRWLVQGR